jgi:malate dehydrogenase (oxaloacetate-decarboxylating)
MNNAIAYPGIFRGALDSKSKVIDIPMMQAAAKALAEIVPDDMLLPEMMDPKTHQTVVEAVMKVVKGK